ncbi:glycosyltransferase [Candidatus Latescibacterota bacterium]
MFDIKGKAYVIVKHTHFESYGTPETELVRFLKGQASSILYIRHPFPEAKKIPLNTTIVEYSPTGDIIRETKAPMIRGNNLLFYIKDVFFSVYYVLKSGRKYDVYISADNLNTLAGLILRILGRVSNVVYYVIDFTPVRFTNRLLNAIYQAINKICCYHADVIWNVSGAMIEGRERIGIRRDFSASQITVPLGCNFHGIRRKPIDKINRYDIVYFGSLCEEHGPGLILEALPGIVKHIPNARVIFVGDGVLREQMTVRAELNGIMSHVQFAGFIESDEEVYQILTSCGLALATYPPGETTYKLFSDPGKVKIYLACGLPVLITDVPPIASVIQGKGAGKIVEYETAGLTGAVCDILLDTERHKRMREESVRLAAEYDWKTVWQRTFDSMEL